MRLLRFSFFFSHHVDLLLVGGVQVSGEAGEARSCLLGLHSGTGAGLQELPGTRQVSTGCAPIGKVMNHHHPDEGMSL